MVAVNLALLAIKLIWGAALATRTLEASTLTDWCYTTAMLHPVSAGAAVSAAPCFH